MFRLKEVFLFCGTPPVALGLVVLAACLAAICCGSAWALGTPAGTTIVNSARVSYTMGGSPTLQTVTTASSFNVLEIIDAVVVWQDSAAVPVHSPQAGAVLTFLLTNTGNGPEVFSLTTLATLAGDNFDPVVQALWLESNGTAGLQVAGATPDTRYQAGQNDPELAADGAVQIYLLSDIPAGLDDEFIGKVQLLAAAATAGAAGAAPGTALPGVGFNGAEAVVGHSQAQSVVEGTCMVSKVQVLLNKSILQVVDPAGGHQPCTGARVTYRLIVAVAGNGTVAGLTVSDRVADEMAYVPESILLDGAAQSDAADAPADNTDYNITTVGTVTVNIGAATAPATHAIEFTTIIK